MDEPAPQDPATDPVHLARAAVLRDLAAGGCADPAGVSVLEDVVTERRWWVEQWPEGGAYVTGLVAQDVQDRLLDDGRRWPVCRTCDVEAEHTLGVEPVLDPDPFWVCAESGMVAEHVGRLT